MVRTICNFLISIILVAVIILVVLLGIPLVQGKKLFVVTTGSMMQVYPINTVVVVEPTPASKILVGDDITFHGADPGTVITHRVLGLNPEESYFTTQGTNNNNPDPPIPYHSLVGRVVKSIPYVGVLASLLQSTSGKIMAGCFLIFVVILLLLPELFDSGEQAEETDSTAPRRRRKKMNPSNRWEKEHLGTKLPARDSLEEGLVEGLPTPKREVDFIPEPPLNQFKSKAPVPPNLDEDDSSPFDDFPPFLSDSNQQGD